MALSLEFEKPPSPIPLADLRKERVVKKLVSEGRIPAFYMTAETPESVETVGAVVCFIPGGQSIPEQRLKVSMLDAKEISTLANKLRLEH